ncbi:MAG: ABC transporter permease [Bacteroidota bacterium]
MLKNHLKIAFRQMKRQKGFTILNIVGLALGIALVILITTFIWHEQQHDKWMTNSDQTYRVYRIGKRGETAWTPTLLARKLMADYPEVKNAAAWRPIGEYLVTYEGKDLYVENTAVVDSNFFNVLQMDFLQGDAATALTQPNSIVLTNKLAKRIFGDKNPVGESVTLLGQYDFMVTAILNTQKRKSHIPSDFFVRYNGYGNHWGGNNRATYVQLYPNSSTVELSQKIEKDVNELIRQEYISNGVTPKESDFYQWALQPLNDVFLHSEGWTALGESGSIRNVYIFAFIALLVMLVAIINYVNLTTARASQRGKEVGIKKVVGAERGLLTTQFLVESILQAAIAGLLAIFLAEMALPYFNNMMDRQLTVLRSAPFLVVGGTLLLSCFIGLLAGSYPAFILSSFQPSVAIKSNFLKTGEKGLFRKVLVTSQFTASITLVIVMAFIYRQVHFMMEKDLGFQPDQVLTIPMNDGDTYRKVTQLKSRFQQIAGVQAITTASHFPSHEFYDWKLVIEGKEENFSPYVLYGDEDFGEVLNLDMDMVAGRFFNPAIGQDSVNNYVVNESFVKNYGIENPIGQRVRFARDEAFGQIIGVIKDFHYHDVTRKIDPLIMSAGDWRNYTGVKLSTKNLSQTIEKIRQIWSTIEPTFPMRYSFLDEDFNEQYADQERFGQSILYATFLTLFIALLGLLGLTAFTVERRTKEIGIRKVLGASVSGIIGLLAKDFMKLLGIAAIIAIPLSYYLTNQWLADFAHRTSLAWWVFAAAGLGILLIAFLTVSAQSIKAARANPIEAIQTD